jgi:putative ABC transport system substrate-binding protein
MRRRDFITLVGGAVAAWPRAASARAPGAEPVVGFLGLGSSAEATQSAAQLRYGLQNAGYIDRQMAKELTARGKRYAEINVAIEFRWANSQTSLLPRLAADLVGRGVDAIVAQGPSSVALAAKAATSTIPIVFAIAEDPVKCGLLADVDRPERNVTGVASLPGILAQKRLELLLELAPLATKVGYLSDPSDSPIFEDAKSDLLAAAAASGREIIVVEVRRLDFAAAFATLAEQHAGALLIGNHKIFTDTRNRGKIWELAASHKLPTMYPGRDYAAGGGLMSYDTDPLTLFHQIGVDYVGPLIDGAKPVDLPVRPPTRFELVLNLKTAKALGLTITPELRSHVTEVIQ